MIKTYLKCEQETDEPTQYGNRLYRILIAVREAAATLSHRYGSCASALRTLWFR